MPETKGTISALLRGFIRVKMPRAVILGCHGSVLSREESRFFARTDPLGFILFARNCQSRSQVRSLVMDLLDSKGRSDAPILIDQEGGRVARLRHPEWRAIPSASRFGDLFDISPNAAIEAVQLNASLVANDLRDLGININCAPVLDIANSEGHAVIGDRAFSNRAGPVTILGREYAFGLLQGGVLPIVKHLPGHGRSPSDTHSVRTEILATHEEMQSVDFLPFQALSRMPIGMVGHPVYASLDPCAPASVSSHVINKVIRSEIGFNGLLLSDDIAMDALSGPFGTRASDAIKAGCDAVLHCTGQLSEMYQIAESACLMNESSHARWMRAKAKITVPNDIDRKRVQRQLSEHLNMI